MCSGCTNGLTDGSGQSSDTLKEGDVWLDGADSLVPWTGLRSGGRSVLDTHSDGKGDNRGHDGNETDSGEPRDFAERLNRGETKGDT